ncbi:hypothetical protein [Treponema primitia]|uniref:hypothetical protein n=1 Tax=Treponema primitia TaxID=88058 RepID=UPI00025555AB|nr:hypothetical protein [Treponema primitia]
MKLGGPEFVARGTSLQMAEHPVGRFVDTGNVEAPRSGVSAEGDPSDMVRIAAPDFKELTLSLGLPQDKLTSSLLSFIKFFSLPLDPKLIQQLRQEVLSLKPAQVRSGAQAAAATAAKGIVLSAEALAKYSVAIAGDEHDGGAGPEDGASQGSGTGRDGQDRSETGFHSGAKHKNQDGLNPEQLRAMVERIEGEAPLLGILNKLPGKDGRRWIVLPFSFNAEGVDFKVSLRILLADSNTVPWKVECIALNVAAGHDGIQDRWAFTLEDAVLPAAIGSGVPVFARALVSVYPPPEHPAALEGKLQELLGTVAKKITLIEEV